MKKSAIVVMCVAVVLLAAAGYYLLHSGRPAKDSMPGAAPTMLSLLPPQAPYVVYADVQSLRSSAFLNRLIALIPAPSEDPEYAEFVRSTGFDYARDLDRVAIAIFPTTPLPTVVTFAEGRFDQQKIIAYALRTGKAEEQNGATTYVLPSSISGGEVSVQFITANRIELISRSRGNSTATANGLGTAGTEMTERISRVAGSPLFAVVRMDAVPKDAMIGTFHIDAITSALQGVKWLTLSATGHEQDLNVVLQGECNSSLDATQLNLALGGLRFMARAFLSDPNTRKQFTPKGADALTKLVKQADISASGNRVQLAVSMTPEILDGLAAPTPASKQAIPAKAPAATPKPAH
jgi:hypothetical protein